LELATRDRRRQCDQVFTREECGDVGGGENEPIF
jgi:hypothetical protein